MAIDFKLMYASETVLPTMVRHDKHDFEKDYNNFVVKQDRLFILANKFQAEGDLDKFLSYADDNVDMAVRKALDDKKYECRLR